MKLLQLLTTALLPLSAFAAKKSSSSSDRFQTSYAKQLSNGGPLKLDDKIYADLTKTPRDYSVAVLLTALESRFGCNLCNEFQPDWELLAKQWTKGDKQGEGRLLFGTLDFADGKGTFQSLQLQTAPVLLLFPPTTGPDAKPDNVPHRFDFSSGTNTAEPIHAWLVRQLPSIPHPAFVRPINYLKIAITTTAVIGAITFLTVAAPYILPILQNRNLWAAVSLIAVLLFTSGHMFNHIRKVPYVGGNGKGKIDYFAGGFQNQFGLETQIVAAMYGILSFATISLALKVPRMADARNQQIAVFVWGAVILLMYSFLLSVFRIKNGGYPFWLPPF
ncbi:oligosaccharyl transferase subunit ost3/OST6 [Teratosphaeriaceae sp. CCFEE 6253]|nr:oligosaccharyl transferase subunit ost3/OST6 [Teratosphaeriaceae sp. CCFEE 6253]